MNFQEIFKSFKTIKKQINSEKWQKFYDKQLNLRCIAINQFKDSLDQIEQIKKQQVYFKFDNLHDQMKKQFLIQNQLILDQKLIKSELKIYYQNMKNLKKQEQKICNISNQIVSQTLKQKFNNKILIKQIEEIDNQFYGNKIQKNINKYQTKKTR